MAVKRMDSSRSLLYQAPYEGRKAVLVMNMPAEVRRKAGASNATLGPYSRRTPRTKYVSAAAQAQPSRHRSK